MRATGPVILVAAAVFLGGCQQSSLTVRTDPAGAAVYCVPYDAYQFDPSVVETEEIEFYRVGMDLTPMTFLREPGRYLLVVRLGRTVRRLQVDLEPGQQRRVEVPLDVEPDRGARDFPLAPSWPGESTQP